MLGFYYFFLLKSINCKKKVYYRLIATLKWTVVGNLTEKGIQKKRLRQFVKLLDCLDFLASFVLFLFSFGIFLFPDIPCWELEMFWLEDFKLPKKFV